MVQDIQTSVPVGQPYNPTFRLTACVNVSPAFLQVPAVHSTHLITTYGATSLFKQAHIMQDRTAQKAYKEQWQFPAALA